jgi:hypothetical protein
LHSAEPRPWRAHSLDLGVPTGISWRIFALACSKTPPGHRPKMANSRTRVLRSAPNLPPARFRLVRVFADIHTLLMPLRPKRRPEARGQASCLPRAAARGRKISSSICVARTEQQAGWRALGSPQCVKRTQRDIRTISPECPFSEACKTLIC